MNILKRFDEICKLNINEIAVADGKLQLSFFELQKKAKSLACELSKYQKEDEAI